MSSGTQSKVDTKTSAFLYLVIVVWTVLCLSGRFLELYAPRSEIAVSAFLILCLQRLDVWDRPVVYTTFLSAILLAGVRSPEAELACLWVLKLAGILTLTSLLLCRPQLYHAIFRGMQITVLVNGALVILGLAGIEAAVIVSGSGRQSTILSFTGPLAKIGAACLFYYLYMVLGSRRVHLADVAGLAACVMTMWRDGSRTAMMLACPIPLLVLMCLVVERRLFRIWLLSPLFVAALYVIGGLLTGVEEDNPLFRIGETFQSLSDGDFEAADETRYDLTKHAFNLIRERPLLGHGFRTAALGGSLHESGIQVVHNAYLQLWAETGLFGLLAFVALMWGWTLRATTTCRSIIEIPDVRLRAMHYNSLFALLFTGLSYMTHPIGTEWGDWIILSGSYAAIYSLPLKKQFLPSPSYGYGNREHRCVSKPIRECVMAQR